MRPPVLLFPSILFCSSTFLFLYFLQQEQTSSSLISGESNCAWQLSCLRECLFFLYIYILKLFPHIFVKVYARQSAACCRCVFHRNLLIWDGCANDSQQCVGIMTWEKPNENNWAGSRRWLLMTLGAQSDMKDYKRRKEQINQLQSLAGWEMKFFRGTLH